MSAKKINFNINNNPLLIEWGNISRSEAVENHIKHISEKILSRAKNPTHLLVHLNVDAFGESKSLDTISVSFELRFPGNKDLFCTATGNNFYDVLAHGKNQMLALIQKRKTSQLKTRTRYKPQDYLKSL